MRIDSDEIAEVIPPTNFKNLIMEQNEATQAFTRSQGTSDVDLNNIGDPPTGVRSWKKSDSDGLKTPTVNFVIDIPMAETQNSKMHLIQNQQPRHQKVKTVTQCT